MILPRLFASHLNAAAFRHILPGDPGKRFQKLCLFSSVAVQATPVSSVDNTNYQPSNTPIMSAPPSDQAGSSNVREQLRQQFLADKSHHQSNGRFTNPWPSFSLQPNTKFFTSLLTTDRNPSSRSIAEGRAPKVLALNDAKISEPSDLQLTWLGHASLLLQINGATVLCDPVFSERCSPVQWMGPKRYTRAPCQVDELPPGILESLGFKDVSIGDWWDEFKGEFKFACTPAQHMTARGVFDRMATLWSSWVVQGPSGHRFFFSGDTAYSSTYENESKAECPAFKQIGQVYGPFSLAAIAIGAYSPEILFSTMHVTPEQAVRIHEDIGSKKSIGIHWGTFVLTAEEVDEPPKRLALEMEACGYPADEFTVLSIGETIQHK
ncbi:beta-lactamase superfamily domain-containing protein [Kickxella alabastrina]|uniref:beta-lactamase superfamily domain-containing protein n=1 Tax=Kickxella alabastrina TaxID=61397 RepID=UPI00221FE98B|nr:beta-lactamase superfamily domain-containing protein [Kickxella alabastrina]KAI7821458.1 beta-lactamase superfamily domain-containing protein [Kickxella alabastrina]